MLDFFEDEADVLREDAQRNKWYCRRDEDDRYHRGPARDGPVRKSGNEDVTEIEKSQKAQEEAKASDDRQGNS